MDNYLLFFKSTFNKYFINVLDINSGVEVVADDIFNLVGHNNAIRFKYCNLSKNLQQIRSILVDSLLCNKETLNWLGSKQLFRKIGYENQKKFICWIRKSLLQVLTLEKLDDFDIKAFDGTNTLS